jgi:hypothetical protein
MYTCGHGFKAELQTYRGVRIFEMNCGEVTTSLGPRDFFTKRFVHEWIDGALDGEDLHKWISLDLEELQKARRALHITEPKPTEESPRP